MILRLRVPPAQTTAMAELPENDWPDDPHDIAVRIVRSDDPDEIKRCQKVIDDIDSYDHAAKSNMVRGKSKKVEVVDLFADDRD